MVISGDEDRSRPPQESQVMIAQLLKIKGSASALLSGAGHISAVEQPNRVSYLLHDFFKENLLEAAE